jgi:anthranilate 1,2-dioxygenase small subunit
MLRDRIVSLRNANEYNLHYDRHLISNVRVRPGDRVGDGVEMWRVTANYAVFQTTLEGQSKLFSTGRYQDEVIREGERYLFSRKVVVIDTFSIPTLLATPL